jgi:hypothetical protein
MNEAQIKIELQTSTENRFVHTIAKLISVLFHPLFVPIYFVWFLLFIHPLAFIGFSSVQKFQTLVIVCINLTIFPLVSVLLLKALGFIESIFLKTQKDRIIPYIACGIFFFWAFTVFKEQTKYPMILVVFILGIFLASSAALLANIYFKVSMHAIGMGGLLGIFAVLFYNNNLSMAWPMALVLIISGIVCTARLLLNTHTPKDIYAGLLIGIATQIAANFFL